MASHRPPPDDYDEDYDRPRRRSVERNWLDEQFLNTPFFVLILFALCCGNIALIFSILGIALCKDPQAKKNAITVLIVSIVASVVFFLLGIVLGIFGELNRPPGRF